MSDFKNVSLGLTLRNTELENKDFCLLNGREVYSAKELFYRIKSFIL